MLRIEKIKVKANDSIILKDVSLGLDAGETVILFGPNGSGKSTLIKAVMGISGYDLLEGGIFFKERDISTLSISERARLGIGLMFQSPPRIHGVKLSQVAGYLEKDVAEKERLAEKLKVKDFLYRDINVDLSGGEMKRAELFQLLLQKPRVLLLDEPESGVDIENVSIMGSVLGEYLRENNCGCLIITHTGYILQHLEAERGCVMIDGSIHCKGQPDKIFKQIHENGYEDCKECK